MSAFEDEDDEALCAPLFVFQNLDTGLADDVVDESAEALAT